MAGHTDNSILIQAPIEDVWRMTNDVESWPELFSEYAKAEVLRRDGATIRFRLTMHPDEQGNEWSWVSERSPEVSTYTVRAHRVERGWFKYMNLFWEFEETPQGVRMRWVQDFEVMIGSPVDDQGMQRRLNANSVVQMERIKGIVEQAAGSG
ncbi:SRPBCC family protein [Streptosporangium soli]|nr:SRPBCC family protein [Streptosporangium sp. KLBMP 9127]